MTRIRVAHLEANLSHNNESQILWTNYLLNKNAGKPKPYPAYMSELVEQYCNNNALKPKKFIISNIVEPETYKALSKIKGNGMMKKGTPGYNAIMGTAIGKLARKEGEVEYIYGQDMIITSGHLANGVQSESLNLIFSYVPHEAKDGSLKISGQMRK